jgi:hypothetical protein
MAVRDMLMHEWQIECSRAAGELSDQEARAALAHLGGPSPGGAAAELGLTRQRIHQLVNEGKLDMIRLRDRPRARPHVWMITEASLTRFRKSKPGTQLDLLHVKRGGRVAQSARK